MGGGGGAWACQRVDMSLSAAMGGQRIVDVVEVVVVEERGKWVMVGEVVTLVRV